MAGKGWGNQPKTTDSCQSLPTILLVLEQNCHSLSSTLFTFVCLFVCWCFLVVFFVVGGFFKAYL